jgi:hypothetical protein
MLFSVRNGLKEDALVDIPSTLALPQLILTISLFTLLVGWFAIFAYLAIRPTPEKPIEKAEQTATLPVVKPPVMQRLPMTPRTPKICTITQQTPIITVSVDASREIVLDHSRH